MLDDLQNTINKLQAFDFGQELETIVENHKDKLPEYVREQLAAGKDGNGELVKIFDRTDYRPYTIEQKEKYGEGLGAITDHITNYMTGAFYESLDLELSGGTFEMDSDVSYFGDIRLRSSESLLEIDEANRRDFAETYALPEIKEALKAKVGFIIT